MTKPNFLIIGAMKSGTTSLYRYLEQHPEIFMSPLKEPHFFSGKGSSVKTWEDYLSLFDGVSQEKAIGEASTTYITSEDAARKIKNILPNVRLIAILRNPVEAAYSMYLMKNRDRLAQMDSDDIANEFENILNHPDEYGITRGRYYCKQVSYYFDIFGRDNVKVLLYDDLKDRTHELLQEVFEFLDVAKDFRVDTSGTHNSGGIPQSGLFHQILEGITTQKRLLQLIPKGVYTPLYNFYLLLKKRNRVKPPSLSAETKAKLVELYRDDIIKLQTLTGFDLQGWLS